MLSNENILLFEISIGKECFLEPWTVLKSLLYSFVRSYIFPGRESSRESLASIFKVLPINLFERHPSQHNSPKQSFDDGIWSLSKYQMVNRCHHQMVLRGNYIGCYVEVPVWTQFHPVVKMCYSFDSFTKLILLK